mmetsp:Transcript_17015/g.64442  ORF Transcript_17015/g.64442 Transcript_17015/m.64442 type:complete len:308 (-) Transcript_17015:511-1434(-)
MCSTPPRLSGPCLTWRTSAASPSPRRSTQRRFASLPAASLRPWSGKLPCRRLSAASAPTDRPSAAPGSSCLRPSRRFIPTATQPFCPWSCRRPSRSCSCSCRTPWRQQGPFQGGSSPGCAPQSRQRQARWASRSPPRLPVQAARPSPRPAPHPSCPTPTTPQAPSRWAWSWQWRTSFHTCASCHREVTPPSSASSQAQTSSWTRTPLEGALPPWRPCFRARLWCPCPTAPPCRAASARLSSVPRASTSGQCVLGRSSSPGRSLWRSRARQWCQRLAGLAGPPLRSAFAPSCCRHWRCGSGPRSSCGL